MTLFDNRSIYPEREYTHDDDTVPLLLPYDYDSYHALSECVRVRQSAS